MLKRKTLIAVLRTHGTNYRITRVDRDYATKKAYASDCRANGYYVCNILTVEELNAIKHAYENRHRISLEEQDRLFKKYPVETLELLSDIYVEETVTETTADTEADSIEESEDFVTRDYRGYFITGNELIGFTVANRYNNFLDKVFKTESEAIEAIENDISYTIPEDDKLDVRVSVLKSAFNSYFGKQVVDEELSIVKTELNGYHVSGCIVETGDMCLSCDIYAQDIDKTESYLAYAVGNNYAIYNQITLVNLGLYEDSTAVKEFFASRVRELSHETIELLY